jgi:L-proline amide hydrolase
MSAETPVREGYIDFEVASAGQTYQTFYKIFGELKPGVCPLIALHGGPGVNGAYLEILSDVTNGRPGPLIVYDQIGNGRSTHLPEKMGDTDFWTVQLFVDELNNLIRKLEITEYDLLGHSWGGILASSFVVQGAPGLRKLVISSSPASMQLWIDAQEVLKAQLPKEVRETIEKHEKDGTTDSKEYEEAVGVYYSRHLCTLDPMPEPIASGFECIAKDPTVYLTMSVAAPISNQ